MSAKNNGRFLLGRLVMLCALSACAAGPDFTAPGAPQVTQYTSGAEPVDIGGPADAQHLEKGGTVDAAWWRLFKSPQLDAAMQEAFANNPALDAARANLQQSQDNLRSGYGVFFPEIDAGGGVARQKTTPIRSGIDLPPNIFSLFTLSATVSYALDLFGENRRMIEALGAEADAAAANKRATLLTLQANVTNATIAKAAYADEIADTQKLIGVQRERMAMAEAQEQAGVVTYATLLSLRNQLSAAEATLPALLQKMAQCDHLLAVLTGHVPAEWKMSDVSLGDLTLPKDLPVSLPSDLVRQRPDILLAEAEAHSASANVGVATAALFPSITLSGNFGNNAAHTQQLFSANSNFWSLGAEATLPVFDAGTRWFKREAAKDAYRQSMDAYRQTVLAAFQQVADALRALENDAASLQAQRAELANAEQAWNLLKANQKAGLATYADMLAAEVQYLQAKSAVTSAMATRFQDTVALYAALGGGWWNAVEPEEKPADGGRE